MENLRRLQIVAEGLGKRLNEFMLVGGAAVEFYATRQLEEPPRPTEDVDVVVQLASHTAFYELEEYLRASGFTHDVASGMRSRYRYRMVQVDVASVPGELLGFENRWYAEAFGSLWQLDLKNGLTVNLPSAPYLLGMKLEAYWSRGGSDPRVSKDMEDIVFLVYYRSGLESEITQSSSHLRSYIQESFSELVNDESSEYKAAIEALLPMRLPEAETRKVQALFRRLADPL